MESLLFINEQTVSRLINWDDTFKATETAMKCVTEERAIQNPRDMTKVENNLLLTMPGYVKDEKYGAIGCKLVTAWPGNSKFEPPLPTITANILLFDNNTGALNVVVAGTKITEWRTAAASAVATRHIHLGGKSGKCEILAILGAGAQGKTHAIAFYNYFKECIKEIRIWNRHLEKAEALVKELQDLLKDVELKAVGSNEDCVRGADVIVTATFASQPIVKKEWLAEGVHINAVGAGLNHHSELEESIYKEGDVYIDHWAGARKELKGLIDAGVEFKGEVVGLINSSLPQPEPGRVTVFQSLGMAAEDCTMARVIYDAYLNEEADKVFTNYNEYSMVNK